MDLRKNLLKKFYQLALKLATNQLKLLKINKKLNLKMKKDLYQLEPSKLSLDIDFELKYKNEIIGNQRNKINVYEDDLKDIFNSRTFCLYEDIEAN